MKKIALLFAVVIIASIGFTSCKKCRTCTVQYTLSGATKEEKYLKECGTKKHVDQYKKDIETATASSYGDKGTVTCVDDK